MRPVISVEVVINDHTIIKRWAKRIEPIIASHETIPPDLYCTYRMDDGKTLIHRYGDGPLALARKMLGATKIHCGHDRER